MKKYLFLLSIYALIVTVIICYAKVLFAEDSGSDNLTPDGLKVVVADGEALFGEDTTLAWAKATALNNARRNALEQAVGTVLHGSTVIYNSKLVSDLVVASTKGLIVKEETLEDGPKIIKNQIYYRTKIRAFIKPLKLEKRGRFNILMAKVFRPDRETSSNLPVFQQNDEIQMNVKANEDSYINIFSVSQDGRVTMLFPNQYFKSTLLTANKVFTFPDETQRALGLKLRVKTPRKLSKAVESVLIIVTKEKVDFLLDENIEEPTITDLMRELSEIDPSLWAEKTVGYEVRR